MVEAKWLKWCTSLKDKTKRENEKWARVKAAAAAKEEEKPIENIFHFSLSASNDWPNIASKHIGSNLKTSGVEIKLIKQITI